MKQKSNKNNNQLRQSAGPERSRRIIDNQLVMPSTPVEKLLQISSIMQNKPNVKIGKINLSIAIIKDYEEIKPNEAKAANNQSSACAIGIITNHLEGKPNQTQFKPNQIQFWPITRGIKPNTNPNKPNFKQGYLLMNRITPKIFKIYLPKVFDSFAESCKIALFVAKESLSMKSFMAKKDQLEQKWMLVDAEGAILGRMAAKIAPILMGKNKPTYTPHVDTGDYVVVVNAEKITVTGKKAQAKEYDYYTHFPGGHKYVSFADMMAKKPEKVIELAVRRMLPKNKLGKQMLKKLKVYRGPDHEHQAQKPEKIELFK